MPTKKEMSFEENLQELETIIKKLELGEVPLDDAIEEYNKAIKLAKACDDKLKKAEEAITKLVKDNDDVVDFELPEEWL